ncbi:MAG: SDR family NAD(P)-dependent oxidoreductase [Burkholderiaceae bacterium]
MKDFAGRVAVITGAGSGFGREFARAGHALGMKLVLADVQRDALDSTLAQLRAAGAQAIGEVVDVAKSDEVRHLADRAYAEFGAVHLLFNNAGVAGGGLVWENTEKDWNWVLGVNLMGVVHGIHHFVPRMLEANRRGEPGHIVNTASIAGFLCPPLMGVYNVSKHAVVALTETLYHDLALAKSTIGTSVLCPAFVPTGIAASERNRPPELARDGELTASMRLAQAQSEKAVSSGKMTAAEVAQITFEAIRAERFYVFTHEKILAAVQARFEAVLAREAPADPFASNPSVKPAAV